MAKPSSTSSNSAFFAKLATGGVAGMCGVTAIFPIDVCKTRMQRTGAGAVRPDAGVLEVGRAVFRADGWRRRSERATKARTTRSASMLVLVLVLAACGASALRGPTAPARPSLRPRRASPSETEVAVSDFCKGTNAFWSSLVIAPVAEYVKMRPAGSAGSDFFSVITAPPEKPGIPRPVWLTIAASAPTGLAWYGYYKYSVEEEIFQYELEANGGVVSGCGGFGTLLPFVAGVLIGGPLALFHVPGGDQILEAASAWILLGQLNLYRRVNEFYPGDEPLHAWWALLPPPLDVVVGLRQVHFLAEFWKKERGEAPGGDAVAETWFPFIAAPRFTLKEFARTPSLWFGVTRDWDDFDVPILRD